jgi:prepilin-type N-terminal cleavage/methylation domain-containing protein
MNARKPHPHVQRGFSLVELAVVLVVLGLVSLLLVQFLGTASQERREAAGRDLLSRADDALLAFAMINSRLPCPASDGGGTEDCAGGQVGQLPYRTLGLPDANARAIRYGVLRRAASRKLDADLTQRLDRYDPMQVLGGGTATELPVGNANGLDLCWALRTAQQAPADTAYLHVTLPGAPTSIADNVAYALALPRAGEGFSGQQAGTAPSFDSPRRPSSAAYRDRVLAVGLDQLWTRMRCGDNVASAGHAHFNAAASVAVMHKALREYKEQLAISQKLAEANVANGAAAVLGGLAGIASAAGGVADTVSEGLASTGIVSYRIALGAVGTVAAIAVTVTAGVLVDEAAAAKDSADDAYRDVDPLITTASALEPSVLEHARTADAAGLY